MLRKTIPTVCFILIIILTGGCSGSGNDEEDNADTASDDTSDDSSDDDVSSDDTGVGEAFVEIPPYPFWPNDAITIDLDHLTAMATDYCARTQEPSADDFFLGDLPLHAFDLQFENVEDRADDRILFGDFYISGFFGGLWLKDILNAGMSGEPYDALRPIFNLLAGYAGGILDHIEQNEDADVIETARERLVPFTLIYAYNLGYLQQIMEDPPDGVTPPADAIDCGDFLLDCSATTASWPFLTRYEDAIDKLLDPPDDRWAELAGVTERIEYFASIGASVWSSIDISGMGEDFYIRLLDLSVKFLLAGKTAALGQMTAWAESDAVEGRNALRTGAGMVVWSASYFMGLAAEGDAFPTLLCP